MPIKWTGSPERKTAKPGRPSNSPNNPSPMGELKISGHFIQRLVLAGGPYLVVLDQPAGVVQVPIGSYNQPDLLLEAKGVEAYCDSMQQAGGRIPVDGKATAVLNAGGPLTNTVSARRQGQDLTLDYHLAAWVARFTNWRRKIAARRRRSRSTRVTRRWRRVILSLVEAAPVRTHGECLSAPRAN